MPIRPFTAGKAAAVWKMDGKSAREILDQLAARALLVDFEQSDETHYVLPPPMAGFFEFSLMRVRDDIDQKLLSELFFQYLNVEEDFIRELFTRGETQLGRAFVHEPVLSNENALFVLDYERASEVIKGASCRGDQHLLLPSQDDARRSSLRSPLEYLHDLQHHGRVPDSPWSRPGG